MESSILVLEEREGRDLLTDGSLLVRWLTGFQHFLREPRSVDRTAVASDDDVDDDTSDTLLSEKYTDSDMRYYGLEHDEVEAAFRSTFSTSKDSDSEHHRSFFGLLAERYEAVWDLLPTDSKLQSTILPIEWISPIDGAIEALSLLEKHSKRIESLSYEQKENVRAWLRSYKETYEDGESTVGQLCSLPVWQLVADAYLGEGTVSSTGSDPEEEADGFEEAEGWSTALEYTRSAMFAPYFYESHHHVLETCLTKEASETVKQLVARGHLYLDALSAEFITCFNELSLTEIQEAIIQRADYELALNPDEPSSGWFDCRKDPKASAALALRSSSKSVWADITRFRA
jgi:hypothetical protein